MNLVQKMKNLALICSADTLVSNALELFIYYLFDQQIRFCMFCRLHLEKDASNLKIYYKIVCV